MILVRDVFRTRYGKAGELVELFKKAPQPPQGQAGYGMRVLTDASGPFFTVVTETQVASLAEWERMIKDIFSQPEFGEWFSQMTALVETGQREFYNIEG